MYKQVNLKFTYDKFRREDRLEKTLKIRESSRFKRLSSVRNLEISDLQNDGSSLLVENDNQAVEKKVEKASEKRPVSRLEKLKKWKEEQQKRREEELKKKQPPFYAGRTAIKKPVINKAPQTLPMNSKRENSRLADSKILPKSTNVPITKITPSCIKTTKTSSLQKTTNQVSSVPKPLSKNEKIVPVKTSSKIGLKEKSSSCFKPVSYISHQSKPMSMQASSVKPCQTTAKPCKPALKPPVQMLKPLPSQKVTQVPKPLPCVTKGTVKTISKGIPVVKAQSKIQAPQISRQPGTPKFSGIPTFSPGVPKFSAKSCVKTPVERTVIKQGPSISTEGKGSQKELPSGVVKENSCKTDEKRRIPENINNTEASDYMELTFNSDISIIKPSFAPTNFVFEPPADLVSFRLANDEDDDDNPFEVLERVKKYLSRRTSTPEKLPGSNSNSKRCSADSKENSENCNDVEDPDLMNSTQPLKDENMVKESIMSLPLKEEIIPKDITDKSATIIITESKLPENFPSEERSLGNYTEEDDVSKKTTVVAAVESLSLETQSVAPETAEKENNMSDDIGTAMKNSVEAASNMNDYETQSNAAIVSLKHDTSSGDFLLDDSLGIIDLKEEITPKDINDKSATKTVTESDKLPDNFPSEEGTSGNTDDDDVSKKSTVVAAMESLKLTTHCAAAETAEKENNVSDDINAVKENLNEAASNMDDHETQCNSAIDSLKHDTSPDDFPLDDSLGIIDLNTESPLLEPISLLKLGCEDAFKNDTRKPETTASTIRKSGVIPKRTSMLRSILTLESISEASELDSSRERARSVDSKQDVVITPRRSRRLSERKIKGVASDLENIIDVSSPQSPVTPRRSGRLLKTAKPDQHDSVSSPVAVRRSMRLIDLNTPEEQRPKTNLTLDFEKLNLEDCENKDPDMLLKNLESPDLSQSKKVSLLYTPERRRRSMRKSIRGDLMSFSPA